jgi:hypothetical protein
MFAWGWQTWGPTQRSEPSPGYGIPLSVVKMVEPHISKIARCGAPQGIYLLLHLDCRAGVGHPPAGSAISWQGNRYTASRTRDWLRGESKRSLSDS